MTTAEVWLMVGVVGAATIAVKSIGPVVLGGRPLPERFMSVVELLAPGLLAALIATQVLAKDQKLVIDERMIGLGVAALALALRAPILLTVVLAAAATAGARAL
jgi:branched-subunit amino acid transport protein